MNLDMKDETTQPWKETGVAHVIESLLKLKR